VHTRIRSILENRKSQLPIILIRILQNSKESNIAKTRSHFRSRTQEWTIDNNEVPAKFHVVDRQEYSVTHQSIQAVPSTIAFTGNITGKKSRCICLSLPRSYCKKLN
jgi:hypothetical protein